MHTPTQTHMLTLASTSLTLPFAPFQDATTDLGIGGLCQQRQLCKVNECYKEVADFADAEAALRAVECGRRHLVLFAQLGRQTAMTDTTCRAWRWTPKHHLWIHCLESMLRGEPESAMQHWAYADEDAIGRAAEVAEAVHVRQISRSVMERYRCMQLQR